MEGSTAPGTRTALPGLVLGALLIAFSPILAKLAVDFGRIGPIAAAFWRVALAAPVFWVVLRLTRHGPVVGQGRDAWTVLWPLLLPGVFLGIDLALWHWSFQFTPVANATVLANFSAVLMVVIGWLWFRERPTLLLILGGVIGLFGVIWLTLGTATPAVSAVAPTSFGDALALGAACFYAGYLLTIKNVRARFGVAPVMMLSSAATALVLLIPAALSPRAFFPTSWAGWLPVLGLALVCHCLGQGLIAFALQRLSAGFSAVTLLIQPVAAGLWGWVILGQALTAGQMLAGGVVLTGVCLARLGGTRKPRAQGEAADEPAAVSRGL
jgi:drug/metabolite transporter (DMT)-like permease